MISIAGHHLMDLPTMGAGASRPMNICSPMSAPSRGFFQLGRYQFVIPVANAEAVGRPDTIPYNQQNGGADLISC